MADYPTNPYMQMPAPDWRQVLSNALIGVGAGISGADASGRGWGAGIGPGLMMGANLTGQQQQQAQQNQMRQMMFGLQLAEFNEKRAERARQEAAIQSAADEYGPGLRYKPPAVAMGPGSYDTKLAGYEGGSKNGGMVFNELGSGAYGPFQFMPATYAGVRAKAPHLNLPEDMTKATREQWDQAHNVLKTENAQGLQAAGFQPTPENLYLAHRFGVGGATAVLRSDPNKPLAEVLPIDWQRQNPDMRGQTVGGFRRLAAERMGGVGVPYETAPVPARTQYALQPNALPAFDDQTLSLLPRGPGRFMPGVLPQVDASPGFTAPVMPQPQATATPAQFTPPPAAVPGPAGPPTLADVPKPELPAEDAVRIRRALMNRAMTPEQARSEANRIVNDLWNAQKEQARARYQQESENYRFNRGNTITEERHQRSLREEGEWVRGADGVERFVPKAERTAGMTRADRRPDPAQPGTEAGDIHILNTGDPASREYLGAYNRVQNKLIDGPGGQKFAPNMTASGYRQPTFSEQVPQGSQGAPAGITPGLTPVGERERKFTEAESKDYGFARRLQNSLPQLEKMLLDDAGKYSTAKLPSSSERMKMKSSYYPDSWLDADTKEFRRLSDDVVTAILRKESGGAITLPEFPAEYNKYIPQPGDTEKEIKAKLRSIRIIGRTYAEGSGRALADFGGVFDPRDDDAKTAPIRIDMSGKRK